MDPDEFGDIGAGLGGGIGTSFGGGWSDRFGQAGVGLGSFLGSLFGKNPYDAAGGYLGHLPGIFRHAYDPYIEAGQADLPGLQAQYREMMQDPGGFIAKMGAGYHESPGFKYQVGEATGAANRAAAAGGMLGSPEEQANLAKRVSGMADQDYQQYLGHVLGAEREGLGGQGWIERQGYGASQGLAGNLASYFESRANLAKAKAESENKRDAGLGGMLGGIAGIAGGFL